MAEPPIKEHLTQTAFGKIEVLLVEDHELIREGMKLLLIDSFDKIEVGEATRYEEVMSFAAPLPTRSQKFDVILLDLGIPGLPNNDWIAGLRGICAAFHGVPVVILSGRQDAATVTAALKNGARGFLPKTTRGRTMMAAIKYVLSGEIYVPPTLIEDDAVEAAGIAGSTGVESNAAASVIPETALSTPLTEREFAAMRLLIAGRRNKAIARELGIEESTVKKRLRSAFEKLGATSRTDAVRICMERNITTLSSSEPGSAKKPPFGEDPE